MFKKIREKTSQSDSITIRRRINWGIVAGLLLLSLAFVPKIYNFAKEQIPETAEVSVEIPIEEVGIDPNLPIQNSDTRLCTDYLDEIKNLEIRINEEVAKYHEGNMGIGRLEMEMYVMASDLMQITVPNKGEALYEVLEDKIEKLRNYSTRQLEELSALTEEERVVRLPKIEEELDMILSQFSARYDKEVRALLDEYKIEYTETEYGLGYQKVRY